MSRAFALALVLACATLASPAEAALRLCNRTSYIVYAATGLAGADTITTRGWIRIDPGACKTALKDDLSKTSAYVYAHSSQAHNGPAHAWGGTAPLCVRDTGFTMQTPIGTERCTEDGTQVPFSRIDSEGKADWTATFTQVPPLPLATDARDAGLVRLLGDLGLLDARAAARRPAMEAALARFRKQMRMPNRASTADLFDALETEALKVAAPAGYSVCNDTDEPLWAALGFRAGKVWNSRGWWKVMPGACARTLTTALSTAKVYLLVESKNGSRIVSGDQDFCITQIAFSVDRRSECAKRGLVAAGFAVTDTRGLTGFAAHVSDDGLLPSLRRADYSSTPK